MIDLNLSLIGIGNKARHGKDTVAGNIKMLGDNVFILHWADKLKSEVINRNPNNIDIKTGNRLYPLIYKDDYYNILDKIDILNKPIYYKFHSDEVPFLHSIFEKRNITEYYGMDGNGFDNLKDGEMLQFWGTDFRRNFNNPNYWIDKTMLEIKNIKEKNSNLNHIFIFFPDTRFLNEYHAIKMYNPISYYINVLRYNLDGTIYYDSTRNSNHISEIELDNVNKDYKIEAISGDLDSLKYQSKVIFDTISDKIELIKEKYNEKYINEEK